VTRHLAIVGYVVRINPQHRATTKEAGREKEH